MSAQPAGRPGMTVRRGDLTGASAPAPVSAGVPASAPSVMSAAVSDVVSIPVAGADPAGGAQPPMSRPAASLSQRFAASLLDSVVAFAIVMALELASMAVVAVVGAVSDSLGHIVAVLMMLLLIVGVGWVAVSFFVAIGKLGQTPGKRTLGVQIVDVDSGGPIGTGRAVVRFLAQWAMGIPCYLGYITYFTDGTGRNRAFHDKAANDVVVQTVPVPFLQAVRDVLTVLKRSPS